MIGPEGIRTRDLPDPDGEKCGIPTYYWNTAPKDLATLRQLREQGLRPSRRADVVAQVLRPRRSGREPLAAYLYRVEDAKPRREATPAQLAALARASRARQELAMLRHGIDPHEDITEGPVWADEITAPETGDIQGVTSMNNRIRLDSIQDGPAGREVFIGWDRGMGTYFAQVYDGLDADGEDIVRVDLGNEPGELTDPTAAIDAVRPYAQVPDDLSTSLTEQRDAPGALERSPFVHLAVADSPLDIPDEPQWEGFDR